MPASTFAPAPAEVRRLLPDLHGYLADGDEGGFLSLFTPGARTLGAAWYRTWRRLPHLEVGDNGGVRLIVSWRLGEASAPTTDTLVVRLVDGRIDGAEDRPGATPIWLRGPAAVSLSADGRTAAIVAGDDAHDDVAAEWRDLAERARERLDALGLDAGAIGWDATVVVEVPADVHAFQLRSGLTSGDGSAAGVMMHAWDQQTTVVINPGEAADWSRDSRQGLVLHEVVHAAFAHQSDHPEWLREGLADWIALPWWPEARASNDALLGELPDDPRLPMGQTIKGERAWMGYLLAEAAVAGMVAENGLDRVLTWTYAWGAVGVPPESTIERWMRAELRRRR